MRKWKYFCPKRYHGHYVRVMVKWENTIAGSLWCRLLHPALSVLIEKVISSCCFLYGLRLLIHSVPGTLVSATHQAGMLSVCWLLNTSQLLLSGPKHIFRIGDMSICVGTGSSVSLGPLLPCPAVCPSAWSGHAYCVCFVRLLAECRAHLLSYHQNQEGINGSYPSHKTQLRLGHSQDSWLYIVAGCISAIHLSPFCMKNMEMPGDYFCK